MALVSYVEAIADGKIVKVPEDYARREGLLIVKRVPDVVSGAVSPLSRAVPGSPSHTRRGLLQFETYRKPLHDDELRAGLSEHFHWELQKQRKLKNVTRRQVSAATSVKEEDIKLLENGVVGRDYVALSTLERYYGVNLRRGGSYLPQTPQGSVSARGALVSAVTVKEVADVAAEELLGKDIDLMDEEA